MAKRFFWFLVAVVTLMAIVGLCGCGHKSTMPPVVVTHTSLQSDSLVRSLFSLLVSERTQAHTDSFIRSEKHFEKTTVNDTGDTLRHDTRTEISTLRYQALEKENMLLRGRVDSLERLKSRVDTVPVPYEVQVEKPVVQKLTGWRKAMQWAVWIELVIILIMFLYWYLHNKIKISR